MSLILGNTIVSSGKNILTNPINVSIRDLTINTTFTPLSTTITTGNATNLDIGSASGAPSTTSQNKLTLDSSYDRTLSFSSAASQFYHTNSIYSYADASGFNYSYASGDPTTSLGTKALTLTSTGSLGIGTTSPAQKLDVQGNIKATGNILCGTNQTYVSNAYPTTNAKINGINPTYLSNRLTAYRPYAEKALSTWTPQAALDINFASIAVSSTGLTITIGDNSQSSPVYYSSNPSSSSWTRPIFNTQQQWSSITWGGVSTTYFVMVSRTGTNRFAYSTDGSTWTRSAPTNSGTKTWESVCWGGGTANRFVAVASANTATTTRIIFSTDGVSWTDATTSITTGAWKSVCYNAAGDYFVAVSEGSGTGLWSSSDATTWTSINLPNSNYYTSICYGTPSGTGQLVAVARSGTNNRAMYSADGKTWTASTLSSLDSEWQAVCWGGTTGSERYVAVASSGTRVMYSTNGTTWTGVSLSSDFNLEWRCITWDSTNQIFIAMASSGGIQRCMTSANGTTWTLRTIYTASTSEVPDVKSIIWAPELGLFASASRGVNGRISTSSDGYNWQIMSNSNSNISFNYACWGGPQSARRMVAVATGSSTLYSSNLTTFTIGSITSATWEKVIWVDELQYYFAVQSNTSSNQIAYSADGITWSYATGNNAGLYGICWSPELRRLVAVGNNVVLYSSDGLTYTTATPTNNNRWQTICWSSKLRIFVALAYSGAGTRYMRSSDGITWVDSSISGFTALAWSKIIWCDDLEVFVAVAYDNGTSSIITSYDGLSWTTRTSTAQYYNDIAWSPALSIFAIAGAGGSDLMNRIAISTPALPSTRDMPYCTPTQIKVSQSDGKMIINSLTRETDPSYLLELNADSAAKPNSTSWTTTSDMRIKEEVVDADLSICYNTIKNIPLKRYKWKYYSPEQINDDNHQLGFIAQEYKQFFPKDVAIAPFKTDTVEIQDCLTVNQGQALMSNIGAIQQIMTYIEKNEHSIEDIKYNTTGLIVEGLKMYKRRYGDIMYQCKLYGILTFLDLSGSITDYSINIPGWLGSGIGASDSSDTDFKYKKIDLLSTIFDNSQEKVFKINFNNDISTNALNLQFKNYTGRKNIPFNICIKFNIFV
jgi:hypothetical protein